MKIEIAANPAQPRSPEAQFREIYELTYPKVLRLIICKTPDANLVEDILQDVYASLFARLSRGAAIRSPLAYVCKIADKELSKRYRRAADRLERETPWDELAEPADDTEPPLDDILQHRELMDRVGQIVRELPLLTYKCFVLFYAQDMPAAQIASALDISEGNVRVRLHRARAEIADRLKGERP